MKTRIWACICLLTLATGSVFSQVADRGTGSGESLFRYVIVDTRVDSAVNKRDQSRRFVDLLVEEKALSKEGLSTIFRLVSSRFPKPNMLYINAYTSLDDVETPEERDEGRASGDRSSGPGMKDSATFTRDGKRMYFIISKANGSFEEIDLDK